jgi:hypothetical protein
VKRTSSFALALILALVAHSLASAQATSRTAAVQDGRGGADEPPREGTSAEIDPLVLAYEFQKATGASPQIARAVLAFLPYKNSVVLSVVRESLEHEPTRLDENQLEGELDKKEREDDDLVEQRLWQRAGEVVRAGALIGGRLASRESLDALEKAVRLKSVKENPVGRTAIITALTEHPMRSAKVDRELQKLLLDFDDAEFDANGFVPREDERMTTPRIDELLAAARYIEHWGTTELDVVVELAELLCDTERKGAAKKLERGDDDYRAGRTAAAAELAPVAVTALARLTGERFTADAEGRAAALAWIAEHGKEHGFD